MHDPARLFPESRHEHVALIDRAFFAEGADAKDRAGAPAFRLPDLLGAVRLLGGGPGADPGADIRANAWRTLLPAVADGSLQVVVARSFALAEAADAIRLVETGHAGGKVVLLP